MSELIGLDEAKLHCRIDNDDSYEDAMIQAYGYTGELPHDGQKS